MFSVGVIFHILLTGEGVFPGKQFNEVLKLNKACVIDWNHYKYDFLQQEEFHLAGDLLKKMLEKNPALRITAKKALNHEYFFD